MLKINAEKEIIGLWKHKWRIQDSLDYTLFYAYGVAQFGGENPVVMSVIEKTDNGEPVSLLFCRKYDIENTGEYDEFEKNINIVELFPGRNLYVEDSIIHFVAGEMKMASVMASSLSKEITSFRIKRTVFDFSDSVLKIQKDGKTEVLVKLNPDDMWAPAKILEGMYRAFESISEKMARVGKENMFSIDFRDIPAM